MNLGFEAQQSSTKTKLEERGIEFNLGAPVTGSVSTNDSVVVSSGDGKIRFFRPNNDPYVVQAHKGVILCMATNGNYVLTGGDDGRFLKTSNNGDIKEIANFGSQWVDSVASHEFNYACSSGRKAYLWSNDKENATTLDNPSTVGGLAFDSSGNRLAVSSYGGVNVWEKGHRRWKSSRFVWKGSHGKVTFSPNGKYLVSSMQENEVHGWRIRDKIDLAMSGYPAKIKSFTWAGDTPYLVTSGASEAICWPFDGKDGPLGRKPVCVADGGKQNATVVENLPGENAVFTGFQDGSVLLSEIDETKKAFPIRSQTGSEVSVISISSDKSHILIGDIKGRVLWSPLWAGEM